MISFRKCSFSDNESESEGGAVAWGYESPLFEDCTFSGNTGGSGGAVSVRSGAPTFSRCIFTGNNGSYGGAVAVGSALLPSFEGSLFLGNSARAGGALAAGDSQVRLTNCTLISNSATDSTLGGGGIYAYTSAITIERSIIALSTSGEAFSCAGECCYITMSCSDVFGNAGGDYVGCLSDDLGVDGNISADPLFCDLPGGDFTLEAGSPCAPANSPPGCELIGAFPVECGTTGVPDGGIAGGLKPWLAVYPNPVRSRAEFAFDGLSRDSVEIYDSQGRLTAVVRPRGARAEWIPSSSAPAGIYFAMLRDPHTTKVVKFLLIR